MKEEAPVSNELSEKITQQQQPTQFVVPGKIIHLTAENGLIFNKIRRHNYNYFLFSYDRY